MYENDEIDVSGVGVNDVERIRDPNEPLNAEYRTGANMSTDYIGFNTEEPPFDDPEIRRAFAMATDRDLVSETVLMDILLPAKGVLPPGHRRLRRELRRRSLRSGGRPGDHRREGRRRPVPRRDAADLRTGRGAERGARGGHALCGKRISACRLRSSRRSSASSCATSTRATSRCSRSAGSPTTRTRRTSSRSSCTHRAPTTRRSTRTQTSTRFWIRPRRRPTRPSASVSTRKRSS